MTIEIVMSAGWFLIGLALGRAWQRQADLEWRSGGWRRKLPR